MMNITMITIKMMKYKSAAKEVWSTMVLNGPSHPTPSTTNSWALLFTPHSSLQAQ